MFRRSVVLVVLSVALTGCSLAGRTFGTYVDDRVITHSIKLGLATDNWRSWRGVTVDTYEATVYLSGEVDTAADKARAEGAAWHVDGVEQVINDLRVRANTAVAASPPTSIGTDPLHQQLPGLRRIDPAPPGSGAHAYDATGAMVATVYVRSLREVQQNGFDETEPTARPITHVSMYPVPVGAAQPEPLVTIVLWHISPAAAAALR